jgi:hypothetical protein
MHLLRVDENSEFSLTDNLINSIPLYAILSHTWGEEYKEVNFTDLTSGPKKTKARYKKLELSMKLTRLRFYDSQATTEPKVLRPYGVHNSWLSHLIFNPPI